MNLYLTNIILDKIKTKLLTVDVGASGGIEPLWFSFKEKLKIIAFEPIKEECVRLNKIYKNLDIKFYNYFIKSNGSINKKFKREYYEEYFKRTSAYDIIEKLDLPPSFFYSNLSKITLSKKNISLDSFFNKKNIKHADFLKIDTDGDDINVLYSAEKLFKNGLFLGVKVETPFHGEPSLYSNTFSNIDRFLRENGFNLYNLEIHRYSKKNYPEKFLLGIPAQTEKGQVMWADSLYFRDLAKINYEQFFKYQITEENLLKLACLFEVFNLTDCLIELIDEFSDIFSKYCNVNNVKTHYDTEEREKYLHNFSNFFKIYMNNILIPENFYLIKKFKKIVFYGIGKRFLTYFTELKKNISGNTDILLIDDSEDKKNQVLYEYKIDSYNKISEFAPDLIVKFFLYEFNYETKNYLL